MAIMMGIDPSRLPENWTLPDTRDVDFSSGDTSFIEDIDEAARRVALAREGFNEVFDELVIRPEFVAQVKCVDPKRPDWCSYTIASIDMDKLLALDDTIIDEFKQLLKDKDYTHATIDTMHTPVNEDAVFLLKRTIDIRDVNKLFADGVEERLRGVGDEDALITSPVDYSTSEDHSRQVFEKAEIYAPEIERKNANICGVLADPEGFSVMTELFGIHSLVYVPSDTLYINESGNIDDHTKSRAISRASSDARKLAKKLDIESAGIDWQVVNIDPISEEIKPILFGTI